MSGECVCGDTGPGSEFGYPPLAPCVLPANHGGAHRDSNPRGFRDDRPATVGTPYHHEDERECYHRADSGWWPYRWEDGVLNRSATTICLRTHPEHPTTDPTEET